MVVSQPAPATLAAIQQQAELLIQQGQAQQAVELLEKVSDDLANYPGIYRLKGIARLTQGSNAEARQIFDQLEASFGDDPHFLNVYGVALRRERDLGRAREIYERALELAPEEPSLLSNHGNLMIDLGLLAEARHSLEKALALQPGHRDALQNMARLERQLGGASDALGSAHVGLPKASAVPAPEPSPIAPGDEEAASDWLKLAATAQRDGNREEAIVFARKALEARPDLPQAYKLAGEVMVALGQREKAEQALLYGALLGEPDPDTLCNLGAICAHRGQFRLAHLLLQKVLHLQPQHKAALQNLERIRQHKAASKGTSNPLF